MEKEFSPITISGIEYESTPIKRHEDDDIVGDEFLTAKDENTTISIDDDDDDDGDGAEKLGNDNQPQVELITVLKSTELLNPVDTRHIENISVRSRKSQTDVHLSNNTPDLNEMDNTSRISNTALNPQIPLALSLYFQLLVNIILWLFMIYLIYMSITTIQSDINLKVDEFTMKVLEEIARCSKEFSRNKCHLPDRPSIMDEDCDQLERCQNQDPTKIAKLKVTIELIAEIINAFVNRLSYKSLLIMLSVLVVFIIHTSLTLDRLSKS